jgi:hypothetical protein
MANGTQPATATPVQVLRARTVFNYALQVATELEEWAAEANKHDDRYGRLLDELRAALLPEEMGTIASLARVLDELAP